MSRCKNPGDVGIGAVTDVVRSGQDSIVGGASFRPIGSMFGVDGWVATSHAKSRFEVKSDETFGCPMADTSTMPTLNGGDSLPLCS